MVKTGQEQWAEAEVLYREIIGRGSQLLRVKHPDVLLPMSNLAIQFNRTGRSNEARDMFEQSLALQREVLGQANSKTLITLNNLAVAEFILRNKDKALELIREEEETAREAYGEVSPSHLNLPHSYGWMLVCCGQTEAGKAALKLNCQLHRRVYEEGDLPAGRALGSLVLAYRNSSKLEQAKREGLRLVEFWKPMRAGLRSDQKTSARWLRLISSSAILMRQKLESRRLRSSILTAPALRDGEVSRRPSDEARRDALAAYG